METAKAKQMHERTSNKRSGCLTCKERRIKCDEAKPVCRRCLQSRRSCQGYIDPFQYHSTVDRSAVSTCSLPLLSYGGFPADSTLYWKTKGNNGIFHQQEKRSFWHFITQTSIQVPSLHDLRVWTEVIPMLSTSFPAIRYALLALSAQHETILHSISTDRNQNDNNWNHDTLRIFSYNQYGKAIRRLNMILVDAVQKYDVLLETLFTCLLLIVCEVLGGSDISAQYHLDGAIKLICMTSVAKSQLLLEDDNHCRQGASSPSGLFKNLLLIFQHLDLQAAAFSGPRVPFSSEEAGSITLYASLNVPQDGQIAGDIKGLRQNLLSIQVQISRFINSDSVIKCRYRSKLRQTKAQEDEFKAFKTVQESLLGQLSHWKTLFDNLVSPDLNEGVDPNKRCAAIVMLVSYLTFYVLLSASMSSDETAYDTHSAIFASIIELSEDCLHRQQQRFKTGAFTISTPLGIDMKLIYPLYITALKCRDYTVRRRAVNLLPMCGREGVWDGRMMASIAQSVILCEEEYAYHQTIPVLSAPQKVERAERISKIPERARFHGVGIVEMDRERGEVKLVCSRKMDNELVMWEKVLLSTNF